LDPGERVEPRCFALNESPIPCPPHNMSPNKQAPWCLEEKALYAMCMLLNVVRTQRRGDEPHLGFSTDLRRCGVIV
jgi:hypothetical protein